MSLGRILLRVSLYSAITIFNFFAVSASYAQYVTYPPRTITWCDRLLATLGWRYPFDRHEDELKKENPGFDVVKFYSRSADSKERAAAFSKMDGFTTKEKYELLIYYVSLKDAVDAGTRKEALVKLKTITEDFFDERAVKPLGNALGDPDPSVRKLAVDLLQGRNDRYSLGAVKYAMLAIRIDRFKGTADELVQMKYDAMRALYGRTDEEHLEFVDEALTYGLTGPHGQYLSDWYELIFNHLKELKKVSPQWSKRVSDLVRSRVSSDSWSTIAGDLLDPHPRHRYTSEIEGLYEELVKI